MSGSVQYLSYTRHLKCLVQYKTIGRISTDLSGVNVANNWLAIRVVAILVCVPHIRYKSLDVFANHWGVSGMCLAILNNFHRQAPFCILHTYAIGFLGQTRDNKGVCNLCFGRVEEAIVMHFIRK